MADVFSPEWLKEAQAALAANLKERNTLTMDQFSRFRPLFSAQLRQGLPADYLAELSEAWRNTVSLYDPVTIVLADNRVVTLPPMLDRVTLDPTAGGVIQHMISAANYSNAIISTAPEEARDLTIRIIREQAVVTPEQQLEYDNIIATLEGRPLVTPGPIAGAGDEFEFE